MVKTRQRSRSRSSQSAVGNILQKFGECYTSHYDPHSGRTIIRCGFKNCNYSTDKNSNFKRHLETMHQLLEPSVTCCGISFVTKGEYRYHTRSIHRDGHSCPTCYKVFNRKALLERHMAIHTGSKPFSCKFCDYASANKANVIRHVAIHGGNSSQVSATDAISELESFPSPPRSSPGQILRKGQNESNSVCLIPSGSTSTSSSISPLTSTSTSTTPPLQPSLTTVTEQESPNKSETTRISHSIASILARKQVSNPETFFPNQLKTNDPSTNGGTNLNWSGLSSNSTSTSEEGLALQLQEYNYNASWNYQHQQYQLPVSQFPGGYGLPSLNYNYYNHELISAYHRYQQNNVAIPGGWYDNQHQPGYYYHGQEMTGVAGDSEQGGDLLPQETRRIEIDALNPVGVQNPDFLSTSRLRKRRNNKEKGAEGDLSMSMNEGAEEEPVVALFVNEGNRGNDCDNDNSNGGIYIPKKLRLSKKYENGNI